MYSESCLTTQERGKQWTFEETTQGRGKQWSFNTDGPLIKVHITYNSLQWESGNEGVCLIQVIFNSGWTMYYICLCNLSNMNYDVLVDTVYDLCIYN